MREPWLPRWLAAYDRGKATQDLVAGLVVSILLVPQSLAYAMLAGLPPHVGMYASILPLVAYAVLGSSMTLSVGPVAVASLMTASAVAPLAAAGSAEYVLLSMLLALLGGVVLLVLGLLRMGFVANLLSHPVISGFVTGSAVLIALGQLKPLLGIPAKGETALELLVSLISRANELHLPTAMLGLFSVLALWASRRFLADGLRRAGMGAQGAEILAKLAPMVVVLLTISAVWMLKLDFSAGVAVVGTIPAGLPDLAFTLPSISQVQALAVPAVMIALIGFVESVSVAQSLAIKRGERINPDAELRGLGAANLASAFSGGFPVTGGFARSVVNFAAGARTPLAGVIAAALMAVVLLGLTGLFERLPLAVLAATIIVAVIGLVDLATLRHAWHYDRADAVAWLVTAVGVLGLGVEAGVGLGVAMSIGTFLWRASRPHIAVVGRVGDSEHFRNEQRFAVKTYPGLLLMRIDESLFFANVAAVLHRIEEEIERRGNVRHLVLDLSSVNRIDLSALEGLQRLHPDLRERGIELHFAEVRGPVMDRLAQTDLPQKLAHKPFLSLHEAAGTLVPAPQVSSSLKPISARSNA
ncbi:sodium-independent anion transporter [Burkholderia cenocepacia]|uniref:SulP family inorganic anion transporter n=1 Tax=Burkholderia cenocepacia TaxID=95486 RepID=UPI0009816D0F|nr:MULTISPECIES: sulfate permease [Burkholderiaceae]ONN82206.1 sodium-independent anion transporter [Burkholderia cenocepacia]ONN85930.1 sodium-independent anion transporter [Burkholderia cenocepacia]ONO24298.1 sodium-independent anion transporter [Burkholderia cenocepacia]ONO51670.1 sodium-independent anion transporter [Burkholderia cenocepacia]